MNITPLYLHSMQKIREQWRQQLNIGEAVHTQAHNTKHISIWLPLGKAPFEYRPEQRLLWGISNIYQLRPRKCLKLHEDRFPRRLTEFIPVYNIIWCCLYDTASLNNQRMIINCRLFRENITCCCNEVSEKKRTWRIFKLPNKNTKSGPLLRYVPWNRLII